MWNRFFKYKAKWNISILVIFVLLASSLIGVLTMNFLKQIISYTNDIYGYHKSYYFSKAWLELALTQVNNAGIGFSNIIWQNDTVFLDNFDCNNCGFDIQIQWKTSYLSEKFWISTWCNDDTAFVLKWWESLVLPMFTQKENSSNYSFFEEEPIYDNDLLKYRNYLKFVKNQLYNWHINLWLLFLSGSDIERDFLFIKSYDTNENVFESYFQDFENYYWNIIDYMDYLSYIILSNTEDEELAFCVHIDDINQWWLVKNIQLPTTKFFISSLWNFIGRTVGLQAIYGQPIPAFLANTYLR